MKTLRTSEELRPANSATSTLRVVEEVAPTFDGAEYAKIGPGTYSAQCVHCKIYRDPGFRSWKALLRFKLLDDGQEVFGFFNLGTGENPHAGRRSRYWHAWTLANGAVPRKRQSMSARVFRGKVFLVVVSDVTRTADGKPHHPSAVYSTVKAIIEKQAG